MNPDKQQDPDAYLTIRRLVEAELIERRSRFLASARPVESQDEAASFLNDLRKIHYTAAHHCSAWRVGADGRTFRSGDDGEPSGSAGRRILGAIDKFGLTGVVVVVTRWFGGIKLGTGGLAQAYSRAAELALAGAEIERKWLLVPVRISFPWDSTRQAHAVIDRFEAIILARNYGDTPLYEVAVKRSLLGGFTEQLLEATGRTASITAMPDKR